MWGPLSAAQLEPPGPQALTAAALWEQGVAGWPSGAPGPLSSPQHHPATPAQPLEGPLSDHLHASQHAAASKLYVQGLPQNLQHPVAVAGLFSPFGDVLDVKLYAAEVRLSGGSAVVRMRNSAQAAAAIAALNGAVPEGGWQQLTVRAAETAEQRSSRISAINGRQQGSGGPGCGGGGPGSPLQHALPPAPASALSAAALRRVHSARGAGSHGALQCYTASGLAAEALGALPLQLQRRSLDWPNGSAYSLDSSRRSSMDVARCGSATSSAMLAASGGGGGGRSSSDSGSGSDEGQGQPGTAASAGPGAGGHGGLAGEAAAAAVPSSELQRMLLEAVLALLGQVESGQLSLPAMRIALEAALTAAKQSGSGEDGSPHAQGQGQELPPSSAAQLSRGPAGYRAA